MKDFFFTRRTVLATLPASVAVSQLALFRSAYAQDEQQNFERALERARENASDLEREIPLFFQEFSWDLEDVNTERLIEQLREREEYSQLVRSGLIERSAGLGRGTLLNYVGMFNNEFNNEYYGIAEKMIELEIPLVPTEIPRNIEAQPSITQMLCSMPDTILPNDGLPEAIWDIIFDVLGLFGDDKQIIMEAANDIEGIHNTMVDCIMRFSDITQVELREFVSAVFDCLWSFLSAGTIFSLVRLLRNNPIIRRLLTPVAFFLVIFVGVGYAFEHSVRPIIQNLSSRICPDNPATKTVPAMRIS